MAALVKAVRVSRMINNVAKLLTNVSISANPRINNPSLLHPSVTSFPASFIHTTPRRSDLMEFFDDPKNWAMQEVKSGRSWKIDELRIKSNADLHKLWFVLLKERNMLMTMEENAKKHWEIFPSPERLDKVQDSMWNLEKVVRERNKAYHLLETGEHGERPSKLVYNQLGLKMNHRMRQYCVPKFMNTKWQKQNIFSYRGIAVQKFLRRLNEKKTDQKRKATFKRFNHVRSLFRRFPNMDIEAVKAKFPDVNIERVKRDKRSLAHAVPK